jgi:hypothetical protein
MPNTITYKELFKPVAILTTETTIYEQTDSSSTGVAINISAYICNTTSAGISVTFYNKETSATAAGTGNQYKNSVVVPGNGDYPIVLPVLSANRIITAIAASTGLTIHCTSGTVIN